CRYAASPGNHDLGQSHGLPGAAEAQISIVSCQRYLAHFGKHFWLLDAPGRRCIAVNSELLGRDLDAAAAQIAFVAEAADIGDGRQLALLVTRSGYEAAGNNRLSKRIWAASSEPAPCQRNSPQGPDTGTGDIVGGRCRVTCAKKPSPCQLML